VDRYVRQILNPNDSELFKKNVEVVRMMQDLHLDNRALNNMKTQINDKVDSSGIISK
jgi:hypothetical protein